MVGLDPVPLRRQYLRDVEHSIYNIDRDLCRDVVEKVSPDAARLDDSFERFDDLLRIQKVGEGIIVCVPTGSIVQRSSPALVLA